MAGVTIQGTLNLPPFWSDGESDAWPNRSPVVNSSNSTDCRVAWRHRVAPTLPVDFLTGEERRIIDPLCTEPVSPDASKLIQNDAAATLESSDAAIYYKGEGVSDGRREDSYSQTEMDLKDFRNALKNEGITGGPPHYACPIIQDCFLIVVHSTFGQDEVAAILHHATPARVDAAFYVVVDGFTPRDSGITAFTFNDPPSVRPSVSISPSRLRMSVKGAHFGAEDPRKECRDESPRQDTKVYS